MYVPPFFFLKDSFSQKCCFPPGFDGCCLSFFVLLWTFTTGIISSVVLLFFLPIVSTISARNGFDVFPSSSLSDCSRFFLIFFFFGFGTGFCSSSESLTSCIKLPSASYCGDMSRFFFFFLKFLIGWNREDNFQAVVGFLCFSLSTYLLLFPWMLLTEKNKNKNKFPLADIVQKKSNLKRENWHRTFADVKLIFEVN